MAAGQEEIRIALVRIEGKQDVTNERLSNVQSEVLDMRRVQGVFGERLRELETEKNLREGERKGISLSSRIMWGLVSLFAGTGIGAGILEAVK